MQILKIETYKDARKALALPPDGPATITLGDAAKIRNGSTREAGRNAANRGDLPTIGEGRNRRVPVVALARMLFGVDEAAAQASDKEATEDEARRREDGEDEEADAETPEAA